MQSNVGRLADLLKSDQGRVTGVKIEGDSVKLELKNGDFVEFVREHRGFDWLVVKLNGEPIHQG